MLSGVRLSTVVLFLGIASLAGSSAAGRTKTRNAKIADTDIQERLWTLEKMMLKHFGSLDEQLRKEAEASCEELQDVVVKDIVSAINGSGSSFETLVNFTQSLTNLVPSYRILLALYNDTMENDRKNVKKMISLARALENEIHQPSNKSDQTMSRLTGTFEELEKTIKQEASDFLSDAMNSEKNYADNKGVTAISRILADYKPDVVDSIMRLSINKAFCLDNAEKVLEAINSHTNSWQKITGLDALFDELIGTHLKGTVQVGIVSEVSSIIKRTDVHLEARTRKRAFELFGKLPKSIKNIFLWPSFCIYSKARDAYLASSPTTVHDAERCYVLIVPPSEDGSPPNGSVLKMNAIGNKLFFEDTGYPGQYFYASSLYQQNENLFVFAWIPGNNTDNRSAWNIELDADGIYLKNVELNEYLYASDIAFNDDGYRYVFTLPKKDAESMEPLLWEIRNCNE